LNLPFFIARRYLFAKKSHNVINIISAISAAGLAIGTAAMIIIMSIYNGFDDLIKSMMSSIEPDILITPATGKVFVPQGEVYTRLCEDETVASVCTVLEDQVFINYDGKQGLAMAKGVDDIYEEETDIRNHIRSGRFSLHKGELPQACVGASLAWKMGINPSFVAPLTLWYPSRTRKISLSNAMSALQSVDVFPSGTFTVNSSVDDKYVILPIAAVRELLEYDDEVSAVEIRLRKACSKNDIDRVVNYLSESLGDDFKVADRFHQNESLYKMIRYEKASIYLILIFIIIIISLNVFGCLTMLIIEKEKDMGTLKSMGATDSFIKKTFTLEGWLITLLGMACGLVLGVVVSLLQQKFGFVRMPGNFVSQAYPVILSLKDMLITTALVSAIGYIVAFIPVRLNIGKK